MAPEKFTPESSKEPNISEEVSPELLSLLGIEDLEVAKAAIASLKQEVKDAPVVGRSLTAIQGKEFVIPITTASQKQKVLDALYDLNIFPWEESGLLIVDHANDMRKLSLAGITNKKPLAAKSTTIHPSPDLPEVSFPLKRPDSLSEHMKARSDLRSESTDKPRTTSATEPREVEESAANNEPGVDTEIQALIRQWDQGLIDETDESFQRRVDVFPSLTLFPQQYTWQKGRPTEKSTGRILTKEELGELYKTAKEGDRKAFSTVMRMNAGLVLDVVVRFKEHSSVDADDLFQEGMTGLMRAIERYDPQVGAAFSTYAVIWIEQRVRRYAYQYRLPITRPVHMGSRQYNFQGTAHSGKIENAKIPLKDKNALQQSQEADGVSIAQDRRERLYLLNAVFDPIDDTENNVLDASARAEEVLAENTIDKEIPREVFLHEMDRSIQAMLLTLTPREEQIIRLRFGLSEPNENMRAQLQQLAEDRGYYSTLNLDGLTLEETGVLLDVSRERIRQIEAKALRKLKHPSRSRRLEPYMAMLESANYGASRGRRWPEDYERIEKEIEQLKNSRIKDPYDDIS